MNSITAYCMDWHIKSSDAFKDLLVEPLKNFTQIKLTPWDGDNILSLPSQDTPLIFCMLPPPMDLLRDKRRRFVWIPMWDQAQGYNDSWWKSLPGNLRIVAFSEVIYKKAQKAGLEVLRLKYFKNPSDIEPATWDEGRIIYYWNRVGMIGPDFVEELCLYTNASELLFKPDIDPGIEENKFYVLPEKLGKTKITIVNKTDTRQDFLSQINRANIVISPRLAEGVGMVFLESMARGCAVIAHNAPTMNEYIDNEKSGILLEKYAVKKKLFRKTRAQAYDKPYLMSPFQDWDRLASLDFETLGRKALRNHEVGYLTWQRQAKRLADFILG